MKIGATVQLGGDTLLACTKGLEDDRRWFERHVGRSYRVRGRSAASASSSCARRATARTCRTQEDGRGAPGQPGTPDPGRLRLARAAAAQRRSRRRRDLRRRRPGPPDGRRDDARLRGGHAMTAAPTRRPANGPARAAPATAAPRRRPPTARPTSPCRPTGRTWTPSPAAKPWPS